MTNNISNSKIEKSQVPCRCIVIFHIATIYMSTGVNANFVAVVLSAILSMCFYWLTQRTAKVNACCGEKSVVKQNRMSCILFYFLSSFYRLHFNFICLAV